MTEELLYFNGIDAESGDYALQPMAPRTFSSLIAGQKVDESEMKALVNWHRYLTGQHWALVEGHDPDKLSEAGWGIVFPHDADPGIKAALQPLVDWRQAQAAASQAHYFKALDYRPGERKNEWLVRHGYGPGPANPEKIPYYLLLVGSPEQIPYSFQTSLDVQYAVGRISFDNLVEYANYAQSVVEAEKQQLRLARRIGFFGVANNDDPATRLSADHLIAPLMKQVIENPLPDQAAWEVSALLEGAATKERLGEFLGGPQTPALLFTASHGMSFTKGHALQQRHQGALLCQDWPGRKQWRERIPENFYFSGEDLAIDANLWGSIAFLFACYGAGTPRLDEFAAQAFRERGEIAGQSFIGQLPQRMLSHPRGGSLAVVGHVERAWSYSFMWEKAGRTLEVFDTAFKRLMQGKPIGFAFEQFNERYAELSTDLTGALHDARFVEPDPYELAGMWTANNDAKNYVVLGDPAVRMMVAPEMAAAAAFARPVITLTPVPSAKVVKAFEAEPVPAAGPSGNGGGALVPIEVAVPPFAPEPAATVQAFGIVGDAGAALQGFFNQLGAFMSEAVRNASTLQVRTYTSDDIAAVTMKKGEVIGAKLRAVTNLYLDGDVDQVVPVKEDGSIDQELFQAHLALLKQSEANRAEMIKTMVSAAADLRVLK